MSEVTLILARIDAGDPTASEQLFSFVYQELKRIAAAKLAHERPGQTLQATALVHEAYLRLVGPSGDGQQWNSRGHFFAAAAEAMRRILIEHARAKQTLKRGGNQQRIDLALSPPIVPPCDNLDDLLALDEALTKLEAEGPAKAELVKLLFFAGLNLDEAAAAQGISRTTAYRHWQFARAWLRSAISGREKRE